MFIVSDRADVGQYRMVRTLALWAVWCSWKDGCHGRSRLSGGVQLAAEAACMGNG